MPLWICACVHAGGRACGREGVELHGVVGTRGDAHAHTRPCPNPPCQAPPFPMLQLFWQAGIRSEQREPQLLSALLARAAQRAGPSNLSGGGGGCSSGSGRCLTWQGECACVRVGRGGSLCIHVRDSNFLLFEGWRDVWRAGSPSSVCVPECLCERARMHVRAVCVQEVVSTSPVRPSPMNFKVRLEQKKRVGGRHALVSCVLS